MRRRTEELERSRRTHLRDFRNKVIVRVREEQLERAQVLRERIVKLIDTTGDQFALEETLHGKSLEETFSGKFMNDDQLSKLEVRPRITFPAPDFGGGGLRATIMPGLTCGCGAGSCGCFAAANRGAGHRSQGDDGPRTFSGA